MDDIITIDSDVLLLGGTNAIYDINDRMDVGIHEPCCNVYTTEHLVKLMKSIHIDMDMPHFIIYCLVLGDVFASGENYMLCV
jgi:hypothetical protein